MKIDSEKYKDALINQGNLLFDLRDYNNAIFYYEKAISFNIDNKNIYLNKGEILYKDKEKKDYNNAIRFYEKAIEVEPNCNIIWLKNANELFEIKDYYNAIPFYEKAAEVDPKNKDIWLEKGEILFQLE